MRQFSRSVKGVMGWGAIALLGLPSAIAQTPRPSIFNEPPYNGSSRRPTAPASPTQELPPARSPNAVVQPIDGKVNLKLINKTGTTIVYQVAGGTSDRTLTGRSEATLQDLKTPTNVTFYRPDKGFLVVDLKPVPAGTLELTFTESDNPDTGRSAMTIEPTGDVYLN